MEQRQTRLFDSPEPSSEAAPPEEEEAVSVSIEEEGAHISGLGKDTDHCECGDADGAQVQ